MPQHSCGYVSSPWRRSSFRIVSGIRSIYADCLIFSLAHLLIKPTLEPTETMSQGINEEMFSFIPESLAQILVAGVSKHRHNRRLLFLSMQLPGDLQAAD